jgi:hypothetical protein
LPSPLSPTTPQSSSHRHRRTTALWLQPGATCRLPLGPLGPRLDWPLNGRLSRPSPLSPSRRRSSRLPVIADLAAAGPPQIQPLSAHHRSYHRQPAADPTATGPPFHPLVTGCLPLVAGHLPPFAFEAMLPPLFASEARPPPLFFVAWVEAVAILLKKHGCCSRSPCCAAPECHL